jgi:ABC-type branched-subunit amino acid transport system ATPase component
VTHTLEAMRQATTKAQGSRLHIQGAMEHRASTLLTAAQAVKDYEVVQALTQQTAQETQEALRFHLESLVQHCLDAIFPGVYCFKVNFEMKRGRTEASLTLEKDGSTLDSLMDEVGGTVVDIVSTALRVAVWSLAPTDNLMVLDEPGRCISAQYKAVFADLIHGISERLGIQFLIVSHDPVLIAAADRVFEVSQKNGRSIVHVQKEN